MANRGCYHYVINNAPAVADVTAGIGALVENIPDMHTRLPEVWVPQSQGLRSAGYAHHVTKNRCQTPVP